MKKLLCLAAATMLIGGVAALPTAARAAGTPAPAPQTMKMKMAHTHKMAAKHHAHHKMAHKASCYDFAWQSPKMKECLAKKG